MVMNTKTRNPVPVRALRVGLILLLAPAAVALAAGNIHPTDKWAWGTNVGWINFGPEGGGVTVYADHLEGYAWGENIGWIRLGTCTGGSPCTYANTSATDYGVNNDGAGRLSGYAWSTNAGWIHFDPDGAEGVTIDPLTGDFDGYAWGENVGWIHFQNAHPAYKVNTAWRPSPPVADAGPDQRVKTGAPVTLDGSGSTDPDGHLPLSYGWAQSGGPAVALSDPALVSPTFTAPGQPTVLTFTLTVTDALGMASTPDEAVVTVEPYRTYLPIVPKYHRPAPDCTEAILNGGFEDSTAWFIGPTPRPARYTTERAQSGARSMLLGLKPGEADVRSYSSVRQAIDVPPGMASTVLSFWYYPLSGLDAGDRQECILLDADDNVLEILMRTNVNTADWTPMAFDLSAYAGRTIKVYFDAYNDAEGPGVTGFYLDDVSVTNCPPPGPLPPPPPPSPTDCYPLPLASVAVGRAPHGVAVNAAAKRVYVANHEDHTLSIVNSGTYALVTTKAVGNGPNGVAYNPANDRIYVANRNANTVSVLRAGDYALLKTINVGSLPNGLAVNPITNRIYVANFGSGTVSVINGATDLVAQTLGVGGGSEPSMVVVNPVTNKAYVSLHGSGRVAVISGSGSVQTVQTVDVYSAGVYGIAVDTLRNLVYVAAIDTFRIAVLDGATDTFLGWAEIRRLPGAEPVPLRLIAVNPLIGTSGHVYVTTAGADGGWNKLLLLPKGWPEYFARAHALDLNGPREGLAFDPASLRVFATARGGNRLAVYLDGEPMCMQNFALGGYQIKVCLANPDGTCRPVETPAGP
jgi:YVTN family beta-propeller protein